MKSLKKINILKNFSIGFCMAMMLVACDEKIDFTPPYKPTMIINATLTQNTKKFSVFILKSSPPKLSEEEIKKRTKKRRLTLPSGGHTMQTYIERNDPISGAKITLYMEDTSGSQTTITKDFDESDGAYTSKTDINSKLVIGNKYWIEILLDGKTYTSTKEKLLPEISGIKLNYDTKNEFAELRFKDNGARKDFYRCKVRAYSKNSTVYNGDRRYGDLLFNGKEAVLKIFVPNSMRSGSEKTTRFTITLYQLSYNAFVFVGKVRRNDQSRNGGPQLFNPPPENLTGNIYEITSKKRVIGIFNVQTSQSIVKDL